MPSYSTWQRDLIAAVHAWSEQPTRNLISEVHAHCAAASTAAFTLIENGTGQGDWNI